MSTAIARVYPPRPTAVYFFGTCIVDLCYPDAGLHGIQLLQRAGLRVIFPPEQSCCGQPAFNSGFHDEARRVARTQIEAFPKDLPVVIPSGSCGAMMTHHYRELFANDPFLPQALRFAARVFELTEFLVNVLEYQPDDLGEPLKVTWHASCHAQREMGIGDAPKRLLRHLKHVELVELQRESECCGFGGTFAVKHANISTEMTRDKAADVCKTGAARLLAGDYGCLMNIEGVLEHNGDDVRCQHIASFLWERTHPSEEHS
jgi:L-lactate dehydrogenase complex protein LldE